jgi:hypothetical protein
MVFLFPRNTRSDYLSVGMIAPIIRIFNGRPRAVVPTKYDEFSRCRGFGNLEYAPFYCFPRRTAGYFFYT